jgi:hypothetical protein
MKTATNFGREALLSLGTCVGKFTKSEKFHMSITFLDYLAQYAKVRLGRVVCLCGGMGSGVGGLMGLWMAWCAACSVGCGG